MPVRNCQSDWQEDEMLTEQPHKTADALAGNLRRHRERLGITRDELARRAGVSPAAVTRYERAQRDQPAIVPIARLAAALGISIDDLLVSKEVA
jgi:transcriptional regulator with XRE-family HTH domain